MAQTLIKNGLVVSTTGTIAQDVLITDGTITFQLTAGVQPDGTWTLAPPTPRVAALAGLCSVHSVVVYAA